MSTITARNDLSPAFQINGTRYFAADAVPFRVWFGVLVSMIVLKLKKRRSRRHLASLDDHQLRDIGLTRDEAMREVRKSYPHWFFDKR